VTIKGDDKIENGFYTNSLNLLWSFTDTTRISSSFYPISSLAYLCLLEILVLVPMVVSLERK